MTKSSVARALLFAVLALFVLGAISTEAQTCTPVKVSRAYTNKDDGTGPVWDSFGLTGSNLPFTTYASGAIITLTGTTWLELGPVLNHGYVDVFAGFGGCTASWAIDDTQWDYKLYDENTHTTVYDTGWHEGQLYKNCGVVPACSYSDPGSGGPEQHEITVVAGHEYQFQAYIEAFTTVGNSTTYGAAILIHVQ